MITFDVFLIGLMLISTLTSLVTEALKKIFNEHSKLYHANTISGIVSMVLSAAIGTGYIILEGLTFNPRTIICIVALVFMSWLCAMVGYDKVIKQIKSNKEIEGEE